jgi:hypothetical protein
MELILCQHEWVRQCKRRYRCNPPKGYHYEEAHYPLSEKLGGNKKTPLWYPDHIVQGILQTLEYNYPCIFTRNREKELLVLSEVYPEYLDLYEKATFICLSYAGKKGAEKGFASEKYRSSPEYIEVRKKSGNKAVVEKLGAFSEEGIRKRLEVRSTKVSVTFPGGSVETFSSLESAAKFFNVNRSTISRGIKAGKLWRGMFLSQG